ncbi:hypothetical protein Q5762_08225 [Streptomyces sp. P9(2023)]|uniref:hypothetical protein n=1 Tax=Streptomyces sp. P9(2023) TaxID=3064394 RepID=UPI0028F41918|nr:hypothetical protein [Streptomyces sp. P9(2023)]MDT9688341.1 hypothetical protein [Streptomyces sp. P9(2023)]
MGPVSESSRNPRTARTGRRSRLARYTAAFAVLCGLAGYVAVHHVTGSKGAPVCRVGSGQNTYEFTPEQASNAATISAVGTTRRMPERAVTIALATALQESALRNIRHGDRDSLGLFQQRPSMGWGTPEQIMDPVYSSRKFYDGLAKVPGYSRLPLTVAAQKVQRSGFPQAYAKHEPDATVLAAALTGRSAAALSCTTSAVGTGEPGDPAKVRAELVRAFGEKAAPKAPAGGSAGTGAGTGAGAGRNVGGGAGAQAGAAPAVLSVPVLATSGTDDQRGWELAHWAVARAEGLRIAEVAYAGKVWRASDTSGAWTRSRTTDAASEGTVRIRLEQ